MFERIDRMASDSSVLARRVVLAGSLVLTLVGMYWIARAFVVDGKVHFGNPVSGSADSVEPVLAPLSIRAEVTRADPSELVSLGSSCNFLVERRQRDESSYYCNAQVMCGGKLLYGGPDRGYFTCRFYEGDRREVVGNDPTTTRDDKDAALHLDTRAGVLRIWDDESGVHGAFHIEAEVIAAH